MKTISTLVTVLLLAASAAGANSFSQLAGYGGDAAAPEPVAAPEIMEDPSSPTAEFDFLVRGEADYDADAELFNPFRTAEKAAGAAKPIPYLDLARAEAQAQGVDLALVLAIIQKESSFNRKAYNKSSGATGLMQLLPSTAKWMGLKDTSQLTNAAVNIKYGVKYMKYLWGEFGEGSPASLTAETLGRKSSQMSLAAYNAGPGNVRKYNDVPPFKETRNYVKLVTEYFSDYKGLLSDLPPAP
jgi:soluble lytic murein transglycosylase-like protein